MIATTTPEPQASSHFTGTMHMLDHTGDVRAMWDSGNAEEVAAARKTFDDLTRKRGYVAYYAEGKEGSLGRRMRDFDPAAERIILTRANQGG